MDKWICVAMIVDEKEETSVNMHHQRTSITFYQSQGCSVENSLELNELYFEKCSLPHTSFPLIQIMVDVCTSKYIKISYINVY